MPAIFSRIRRPEPQPSGSTSSSNPPPRQKKDALIEMRNLVDDSLSVLRTAATIASDAVGDGGVPGLGICLTALMDILEKIRTMRKTVEGIDPLHEHIVGLSELIIKFNSRDRTKPLPKDLTERMEKLSQKWKNIANRAKEITGRSALKRSFTASSHTAELEGLIEDVSMSIQQDFLLESFWSIEGGVVKVEEDVERVAKDVHIMKVHLDASFMPMYAKRAHYKASNVRKACLEGTRMDILEELWTWIVTACAQTGTGITHVLYWVNGLAGTGKTTIAISIAERCEAQGLLAANFFFARDDTECNKPDLAFVTISRQLCYYFPPLKEKVTEVLSQNPNVVHSDASTQFEKLVLEPLEKLECDFPRAVVVIDALDECHETDKDATSTIIGVISKFDSRIAPFLAFVAMSRPALHVAFVFSKPGTLKDATTRLFLHEVNSDWVSDDIYLYLQKRLADAMELYRLPADWLSSEDLARLVQLSAGLFIWAVTACYFIMDRNVGDPEGQLQELLNVQSTQRAILDPLFVQVSEDAFSSISVTLASRLQSIVGTIILAQEPLSVATLAVLSENQESHVRRLLDKLSSVLYIPEADNEPICIIHPSFADYLLASSLRKPRSFSIDVTAQHARLFSRLLYVIGDLRPNIAHLPTPSTPRVEMTGLTEVLEEEIPAYVRYSCSHWVTHMELCDDAERMRSILDSLDRFLRKDILVWLETCSLMRALHNSISNLRTARNVCQKHCEPLEPLVGLISDCLRFVQIYFTCIDATPLQLYHSLLSFVPTGSPLEQVYTQKFKQSLLITQGRLSDWGPLPDVLTGHNGHEIWSVSFSRDGSYFATGGKDNYIRIWELASRIVVRAIYKHDRSDCVAISPDGTQVASTPNLRVWNLRSGELHNSLKHTDAESVVYSLDGSRMASNSLDFIKLWDPLEGTCLATITSVRAVRQIAISPNGALLGGLGEDTAILYDTHTGSERTTFSASATECVAAFAPNGRYIASRTSTGLNVSDLDNNSVVRTIDVPAFIWHIAFSRDGNHIGCASNDGRVRIWAIASDNPPRVFAGHRGPVTALSWGSDDQQIVSTGVDGTIRIWDFTQRHIDTTSALTRRPSGPTPISRAPRYATLCHLGSTALCALPKQKHRAAVALHATHGSQSVTLHTDLADAWDMALQTSQEPGEWNSAQRWTFLTGVLHVNMGEGRPVAWSRDRSLIASRLDPPDRQNQMSRIQLSSETGQTVELEDDDICAFTFSSDGTRLATTHSRGPTLRLWDTTDVTSWSNPPQPIRAFPVHMPSHDAIAFSHDGSLIVIGTVHRGADVYDATTGRSMKLLRAVGFPIQRLAFSADNKHVIAQDRYRSLIWDVASGNRICELPCDHGRLIHAFDYASDDTGILVTDDDDRVVKISLWTPGDRYWPAYIVTRDGWVYAKSPGRVQRLCWIPPAWRYVFPLGGPRFCSPDVRRRMAVVFDVSNLAEYIQVENGQDLAADLT